MKANIHSIASILQVLCFFTQQTQAQNCYYPNGNVSTVDAACFSGNSACCPKDWACLGNGLCYYPPNEYYDRRTCTDQTWESSDCPQFCTQHNTAAGNEAIKQCNDGNWCCNGDRVHMDCCTMDDPEVIQVSDLTIVGTITNVPTPTPTGVQSKTSSRTGRSTTSTSPSTTSTSPSTAIDSGSITRTVTLSDPSPSAIQASTSDFTGGVVTVTSIATASPFGESDSQSGDASSHNSSKNLAIGLGVGLPIIAITGIICALLLWRRKKQLRNGIPHSSDHINRDMVDMYSHGKNAHEADSMPVAVSNDWLKTRPLSEMAGSNYFPTPPRSPTTSDARFQSSQQHSPAVSNASTTNHTHSRCSAVSGFHDSPTSPVPGSSGGGGGLFITNPSGLADLPEEEAHELPPEGNPPRDPQALGAHGVAAIPKKMTSGYEPYGRAYGPVSTTYVPGPEGAEKEEEVEGEEGEKSKGIDGRAPENGGGDGGSRGPRPQGKGRNDELMLD